MADGCENWDSVRKHSLDWDGAVRVKAFKYGSTQSPEIEMEAGESIKIITEWNFTDPRIARDWSVVVWGNLGEIELTHDGGEYSDSLPYIEKGGNSVNLIT